MIIGVTKRFSKCRSEAQRIKGFLLKKRGESIREVPQVRRSWKGVLGDFHLSAPQECRRDLSSSFGAVYPFQQTTMISVIEITTEDEPVSIGLCCGHLMHVISYGNGWFRFQMVPIFLQWAQGRSYC